MNATSFLPSQRLKLNKYFIIKKTVIRQLKYKILKLYHTVYQGGGISHGEILLSGHLTAGANLKGEGVGGKATLDLHSPFSPSFPFSCCVACHTCHTCSMHAHLFLAPACYAGYENSVAVESITYPTLHVMAVVIR